MNLSTLSVYHLPIYLSNLAFRYIMCKSLALVLIYKSTILLFDGILTLLYISSCQH